MHPEQVIITSGAQHAFDLIGRVFIEPKIEIWIEEPGYFGVKKSFQTFGAKFVPVPVDRNGFNLAAALKKSRNARLAYVSPSHQFPLGHTMSLARRLALLEWARKSEGWIVEDDYDSEFVMKVVRSRPCKDSTAAGACFTSALLQKPFFPRSSSAVSSCRRI